MALDTLVPMWSLEGCDRSTDDEFKIDTRNSKRGWSATSNDPYSDTCEIIEAQSTLRLRQSLPQDVFRRMNSLSVEKKSPLFYIIRANFMAKGSEAGDNPLDEPAQFEEDFIGSEEAIDEDYDGKPIATKNGEGFDPPVTDTFYDYVITVTKNLANWDRVQAAEYMGAVSSDTFLGYEPGRCKMIGLKSSSVATDDYFYFRVSATVIVRKPADDVPPEKTWWKRIRHEGYLIKDADGNKVHAREILANGSLGQLVTKPVQLKLNGERETDPDRAHWLFFRPKNMRTQPFSSVLPI